MSDAYERRQKQLQRLRDKQRERDKQGGQSSANNGEAPQRQSKATQQQDQGRQGQAPRRSDVAQPNQLRQRLTRRQEYNIDHVLEQCREHLTLLHLEWVPLLIVTEEGAKDCRKTPLTTRAAWAEVVRRLDMIFWFADRDFPHWSKKSPNMRRARQHLIDLAAWAARLPNTSSRTYAPDEARDIERVDFFRSRFHALSLSEESPADEEPNGTRRTREAPMEPDEAGLIPLEHPDGAARQGPEQPPPQTRDFYLRVRFSGNTPTALANLRPEQTRDGAPDEPIAPRGYTALRKEFVALGLLPPETRFPPVPSTRSAWQSELDDLETRLVNRQRSHVEDSAAQEGDRNRHEVVRQLSRLHKWVINARRLYAGTTVPGANFCPDGW